MAMREVPAQFRAECDGCKATVTQTSKHRPNHWIDLTIGRDAYDYQGVAMADGTVRRLLCPVCGEKVVAAINVALSPTTEPQP